MADSLAEELSHCRLLSTDSQRVQLSLFRSYKRSRSNLCSSHTHRVLYVDTHSLILLHPAVQLVQLLVCALTVFAQLCVVPLQGEKWRTDSRYGYILSINPERHSLPNLRLTCRYLSKQSSVWLRVFMKYSVSSVNLWSPFVTQSAQRGEQKKPIR